MNISAKPPTLSTSLAPNISPSVSTFLPTFPEYEVLSPDVIPQLDGPHSSPLPQLPFSGQHQQQHHGPSRQANPYNDATFARPTLHHVRSASFKLDKNKQLRKLKDDTTLADYEIEISQSNENINIYCNTGFYTKVAFPSFQDLAIGQKIPVGNISVLCHDVTERVDAMGAATATVIMFRFSQENLSLGGVTVHLHHTTRNVQIQGSALFPDNKKAPVWFVDNVIKERFSTMSKGRAYDISHFNKTVGSLVTEHLHQVKSKCWGCKNNFNGRSVPEQCAECKQYFHKFKCFPSANHPCHIRKRSQSFSSNPQVRDNPTGTRRSAVLDRSSLVLPNRTATSSTLTVPHPAVVQHEAGVNVHIPVHLDPAKPATVVLPPQSQPGQNKKLQDSVATPLHVAPEVLTPVTSTWEVPSSPNSTSSPSQPSSGESLEAEGSSSGNCSQPALNPTAAPFTSSNANVGSATIPKGKDSKAKNKKSKNVTAIDNESLELEYAKYEVNVTQAKLRTLESTNRDLKFRNNILESRIQELEKKQKQDIYDRYFPRSDDVTSSPATYPHRHCSCSSHLVLPCCSCSHAGGQSKPYEQPPQNVSEQVVRDLVNQMGDIKIVAADLKCKMDIIFDKLKIPEQLGNSTNQVDPVHQKVGSFEEVVINEQETSKISIDDAIHDLSDDLN